MTNATHIHSKTGKQVLVKGYRTETKISTGEKIEVVRYVTIRDGKEWQSVKSMRVAQFEEQYRSI